MNYHSASTAALPPAKTIDIEGIKTSYHVAGTGQPIVFIYGGNFGTADFSAKRTRLEFEFRAAGRTISGDRVRQDRPRIYRQSPK